MSSAIFIAITSIVLVYSVISNFGVIAVVMRSKKLRTVTNMLVVNLAVSDILLAGLVLPQDVHDVSHAVDYFERRSF